MVRRGAITQPFVESMAAITALGSHGLIPEMVKELPASGTAAVTCTGFNRVDVREYIHGGHPKVVACQSTTRPSRHGRRLRASASPSSPSSAPSERVFSLVKSMFGDEQLTSLADQIQAAVVAMLTYNKRAIG